MKVRLGHAISQLVPFVSGTRVCRPFYKTATQINTHVPPIKVHPGERSSIATSRGHSLVYINKVKWRMNDDIQLKQTKKKQRKTKKYVVDLIEESKFSEAACRRLLHTSST
jgi:hypothetical protein